jgi:hypothetical protein
MDVSFASALKMGTDAIRSVDPAAFVSIGGAQMPGWGGYDYYRLTQSLTAMEPYNIGNNVEIIRSLNPSIAMVTTSFARGPWEKHRVWYELLHGSRGIILWDDKSEYVGKDLTVGERGREAEPYYNELRRGMGALIINSRPLSDPIAVHYSQASMRVDWMLAQRPKGEAWVDRNASTERLDSDFMRQRESWCRLLEDLGLQFRFVSYGQVEDGELLRRGYRVLILPRSHALSQREADAINEFMRQGGVVLADNEPGTYDEHARKLARSRVNSGVRIIKDDILNYHQARLVNKEGPVHTSMAKVFAGLGIHPQFRVHPTVGVETHTFRNGGVHYVALLSNPQLRVNELGPPEFKSNARFEKPQSVTLALPRELHVYDVRAGKPLGVRSSVAVTLDPYEPSVFTLSPAALPGLVISAPAKLRRGETAQLGIAFAAPTPAAGHVVHVEVRDPSGADAPHYSGNVRAESGVAAKLIPFALSDPAGEWQVVVRDIMSGQTQSVKVGVE